jgi:hypothetical protein
MTEKIDIVELAQELAESASTTGDPATGRKLTGVVERILAALDLPAGCGDTVGGERELGEKGVGQPMVRGTVQRLGG